MTYDREPFRSGYLQQSLHLMCVNINIYKKKKPNNIHDVIFYK